MRKPLAYIFSLAIMLMALFDSCVYHDLHEYVCEDTITFSADIRPIILTKCAILDCHNGDMGPDLNWTNFDQFHARAASGLVKYRVTNRIMPPSFSTAGPLSQEEINAIACWSDQGALNN